jgi:hypothetical protein
MTLEGSSLEELEAASESALEGTAAQLRGLLADLTLRLRPFPAFLNMLSVQAVELEPPLRPVADRGCVVVLPDGDICRLDLTVVPGVQGVRDVDHVEEFRELDLSAVEYIVYAATAIRELCRELRRRAG